MATTISTTTAAGGMTGFNGRKLDRCQDGTLVSVAVYDVPNAARRLHYSKDNGATWTYAGSGSDVAGAINASVFCDLDDYLHLVWKQQGTGGARLDGIAYYARGVPNAGRTAWTWSAAVSLTSVTSFDFPDVVACRNTGTGGWDAFIVASYVASTTNYAQYQRIPISSAGAFGTAAVDGLALNNNLGILGGSYAVAALTYPSIDFNHTGDGKTVAGGTPHLYVGWTAGATGAGKGVRFRKAVYSAGAWTWNAEREISTGYSLGGFAGTWMTCHFDGTRAVLAGFLHGGGADPSWFLTDRDAADSATTTHIAVTIPAASYWAHGSSSYDAAGNVYVLGRDGSGSNGTRLLNYRKWTRSGATMSAATTFDTTGSDTPYISAKRGYKLGSSIDWVWTDGTASPYNIQFERVSLNNAPNAPTLTAPIGNVTLDRALVQRFTWTFSDPDTGDSQSKFDLRYRIVGAGTWTDTTGTTPNQFVDFAAGTFAAGSYEWQVRTYDAAGVVGPYSASEFFTAASAPATPTITAPVNNETIGAQEYTATWSAPSQDAYQLRTVADAAGVPDTAVVYTDSGTVVSTSARSRPVTFAVNNHNEHIQVRVLVNGLWSSYASVRVLVSFTPPATPTIAVAANSAAAKIDVTLANPAPAAGQPTVSYLDLLRREGSSGDGIRIATALPAGVFSDLTPASGVVYQYKARAVATNGTTSESAWTA